MNSLTTQMHRALFALPLLAVGLAAAWGAGSAPSPSARPAIGETREIALELPEEPAMARMLVAKLDCESTLRPAGAMGLARMPGDIGSYGRRLRCAQ